MKKITALLLSLLLVFSLVGCGGSDLKKDALQALKAASTAQSPDKNGNAQFDMDFTMDMMMTTAGEEPVTIGFGGNMKAIYEGGAMTQMLFVGEMTMGPLGAFDMAMFKGTDGKYYTSVMGMTSEADENSTSQFDNLLMTDDSLTEDSIKSAEKNTNADGSTTYIIVLDGKALANSQALKNQLSQTDAAESYDISDVTYQITIGKDGKPMKAGLVLSVTSAADGASSKVDIKVDIIFNSFDNVVIDVTPYES